MSTGSFRRAPISITTRTIALDLPLHQSRPNLDDFALRRNDVIRIYDIVFDYKTLLDTDSFYRELIRDESFARPMGTAEFHHEVGRYLHGRAQEIGRPSHSLLAAAFEADVPIYTSSPGDSSIGMNLAALSLQGGKLQIDTPARRQRDGGHRLQCQGQRR